MASEDVYAIVIPLSIGLSTCLLSACVCGAVLRQLWSARQHGVSDSNAGVPGVARGHGALDLEGEVPRLVRII